LVTGNVGDGRGRAPPIDGRRLARHHELVQQEHVFRQLYHDRRFTGLERCVHSRESERPHGKADITGRNHDRELTVGRCQDRRSRGAGHRDLGRCDRRAVTCMDDSSGDAPFLCGQLRRR
jgi:hypothetical protein